MIYVNTICCVPGNLHPKLFLLRTYFAGVVVSLPDLSGTYSVNLVLTYTIIPSNVCKCYLCLCI